MSADQLKNASAPSLTGAIVTLTPLSSCSTRSAAPAEQRRDGRQLLEALAQDGFGAGTAAGAR